MMRLLAIVSVLAWRNLWRNKRRTGITLFSIAFGVLLMNAAVPLIDRFTAPRILGRER